MDHDISGFNGMTIRWGDHFRRNAQGLIACAIVSLAALFLADNYGAPVMVFALLLGMSVSFLHEHEQCTAGIDFSASTVLRTGVVLLGANIVLEDVMDLGWATALLVIGGVAATIAVGAGAARVLKLDHRFGLLSGGAVAICGIAAAMTLSSVMPRNRMTEHYTLMTILMVAAFGAVAMVVYPVIAGGLGLSAADAGLFIGGSIHDVSHVVGASYSIAPEVGHSAMVVKMLRVALLIPVAWFFYSVFRRERVASGGSAPVPLPFFLVAFVAVVLVNNLGWIPGSVSAVMSMVSKACFVVAIVALGMKTSFKGLLQIGWRPLALVLVESAFLGLAIVAWVLWR
ncbi:MAG: putative sulfate exporter family transporter [Gammaproteobacteria bacterium]|nr:putative sulfate exporter family transporter [Gammaproteobacteria bacterium]